MELVMVGFGWSIYAIEANVSDSLKQVLRDSVGVSLAAVVARHRNAFGREFICLADMDDLIAIMSGQAKRHVGRFKPSGDGDISVSKVFTLCIDSCLDKSKWAYRTFFESEAELAWWLDKADEYWHAWSNAMYRNNARGKVFLEMLKAEVGPRDGA